MTPVNKLLYAIAKKTSHHPEYQDGKHITECPVSSNPSHNLIIEQDTQQNPLLTCEDGCTDEQIYTALNMSLPELLTPTACIAEERKPTYTKYHYTDEHGNVICTKVRKEAANNIKDFFWEHVDNHGNTIANRSGCRRTLYNFPAVIKGIEDGKTIYLVEGEKDVETLRHQGLIATTTGSSSEWCDEYTQVLTNAHVALLHDYDKAGIKRRDMIIQQLTQHVREKKLNLRIVDLPAIEYTDSHGKDITDWLNMGHTIDELEKLVQSTTPYVAAVPAEQSPTHLPLELLRVVSIDELLRMALPPRQMLLAPFLPSQGLVLLFAKRGVGKTHVALGIAYAVATGGQFLRWSAEKPHKVLYVDGEMPAVSMQERLKMLKLMNTKQPEPNFFNIVTPDLQSGLMPNLSLDEGRQALDKLIVDVDLIVIDNISCLFRSGGENEAESWQAAQEWALDLRRRGKAVLFVHHAGKNGVQRGTSKREDILDTVVMLEHADGYKPSEGASFNVTFSKARHFSGEDATGFHACLSTQSGESYWIISDIPSSDTKVKNVAEKKNSGATIQEIRDETGYSKSQVETLIKKGRDAGLITE